MLTMLAGQATVLQVIQCCLTGSYTHWIIGPDSKWMSPLCNSKVSCYPRACGYCCRRTDWAALITLSDSHLLLVMLVLSLTYSLGRSIHIWLVVTVCWTSADSAVAAPWSHMSGRSVSKWTRLGVLCSTHKDTKGFTVNILQLLQVSVNKHLRLSTIQTHTKS